MQQQPEKKFSFSTQVKAIIDLKQIEEITSCEPSQLLKRLQKVKVEKAPQ